MLFYDFCQVFKSTFFTEPIPVTTSYSSGRYLKTYQNYINWVNNSVLNAKTEPIFVFSDNFGGRHPE